MPGIKKQAWIPFLEAHFPPQVTSEIAPVFNSGFVGAGEVVGRFESALSEYLEGWRVAVTSSCTAALSIVYKVLAGAKTGTKVLSTPMTCLASNTPLLLQGFEIEWLDVDPLTGNVTADSVREGLRCCPEAVFVVIVDWAGVPCDYTTIATICHEHGVPVVLDAAQSFGSTYKGFRRYPHLDFICYSFGPTKIMSAVEGGGISYSASETGDRLRRLRWYGVERESRDPLRFWEYQLNEIGERSVSNNVFAAAGLHMLGAFDQRLRHHHEIATLYTELLRGVTGLTTPPVFSDVVPNFWMYTVTAERRDDLIRALHDANIHAATPHNRNDRLLERHTASSQRKSLPGVDQFSATYLCLPIGPWVSLESAGYICDVIHRGW